VIYSFNPNYRKHWADYFDAQGIKYAFYSAALGIAIQEARKEAEEALERTAEEKESEGEEEESTEHTEGQPEIIMTADDEDEDVSDPRIRILSVPELEELFIQNAPPLPGTA
jgi:large subunit GTPase 1